jgi:glutathione S-transferase
MLPEWHTRGYAALGVMETHLQDRNWFAGKDLSLADIALYAYTHCAADGGFSLQDYPRVRAWISRVETMRGFTPMMRPETIVQSQM